VTAKNDHAPKRNKPPSLVLLGEVVRHRRLTLQQCASSKSDINDSAGKEIPDLMARSGINSNCKPLFC
jgi:hypothetical protein